MLFHSASFIFVFLPAAFLIFYGSLRYLGREAAIAAMVAASLLFYAYFHAAHVALLSISIAFNFLVGERIRESRSLPLLSAAVAANLAILAFFKYGVLLAGSLASVSGTPLAAPDVVLPLAISFFTFQQIAYLVDVRNAASPRYSFLRYAFFVSFFPHLVSGPLLNHRQVLPQLSHLAFQRRRLLVNLALGVTLFAIGLTKKVGIADSVAPFADRVFGAADGLQAPTMVDCWVGAFAYAMQIYFDFSGYSDMAIGLGCMFGIRLPINFLSPYQAMSIIDFWRRWHITLSQFLKNYLYIPLGGNRHGPLRRYLNILVVMVLGGLWHGADWAFALWGALHGIYLAVNHAWRHYVSEKVNLDLGAAPRIVAWALTMTAVVVAWVPFRAGDIDTALSIYRSMFGFNGLRLGETSTLILGNDLRVLQNIGLDIGAGSWRFTQHGWLVIAAIIAFLLPNAYELMGRHSPGISPSPVEGRATIRPWLCWRPAWPLGFVIVGLAGLAFLGQSRTISFLYFQF